MRPCFGVVVELEGAGVAVVEVGDGHAHGDGLEMREFSVVDADEGREFLEAGAARGGVEGRPCGEGGLRRGDGGVGVGGGGFGDWGEGVSGGKGEGGSKSGRTNCGDFAGCRTVDGESLFVGGFH